MTSHDTQYESHTGGYHPTVVGMQTFEGGTTLALFRSGIVGPGCSSF